MNPVATYVRVDTLSKSLHEPIICGQGPAPPSPLVVERFQGVISQLFQQVFISLLALLNMS